MANLENLDNGLNDEDDELDESTAAANSSGGCAGVGISAAAALEQQQLDDAVVALLKTVPKPASHRTLRFLFALLHGAGGPGMRCGRVFAVNIFLVLLMICCYGLWWYIVVAWEIRSAVEHLANEAQVTEDDRMKIKVGIVLQWTAKGAGLAMFMVSLVTGSVCIHSRSDQYHSRCDGFFSPPARSDRWASCTTFVADRRKQKSILALLASYRVEFVTLWAIVMPALVTLDFTCNYNPSEQAIPHTWWRVVFFTYLIWIFAVGIVTVAFFAAYCDDLVLVISSVGQRLCWMDAECGAADVNLCPYPGPVGNHGHERASPATNAITIAAGLHKYVVEALAWTRPWFFFYYMCYVVTLLLYCSAGLLSYLSGNRRLITEQGAIPYLLLMLVGLCYSLLVPMYFAGCVTSAWDKMIWDVQTSLHWVLHMPDKHHYTMTYMYLERLRDRGGFTVCGIRVVNSLAIRIILVIITFLGLLHFV